MRRFLCCLLCAAALTTTAMAAFPLPEDTFSLSCTSSLLMERQTGTVI